MADPAKAKQRPHIAASRPVQPSSAAVANTAGTVLT